ncbi:ankyrin repeat domain-containing protein [Ferruginivarius sediminum]|nr:ankyrin repeat domain-containing protein [Ferruginivarius sediminum]
MDRDDLLDAVARRDHGRARAALDAGVSPDAADRLGVTALLRAAGQGDRDMVALLLEHGATVDKSSDQGNTPLMLAAARGHVEVVGDLLAAGAAPGARNKWDYGPREWGKWPANAAEIQALLAEYAHSK